MWQQIIELLTYDPSSPLLFNSGLFLVLFLLFVPVFYLLRKRHLPRTIWVVLFSLYFYYLSSGVYFVLLILLATTDFIIGRQIARSESRSGKKGWLILSLLLDLGLLCYFKYTNFLYDSFAPLFGASPEGRHFDIFLPVGISFFTFQSLSYVIDIYRGKIEPLKRWIDYLFYISFFPQLVAGPIVRAVDFIPQIHRIPRVSREDFGRGLFLIICGLLKKGVISDYISLNFVDRVFDQPLLYSGFENLMGVYGYALQIYCDFSGYSDIAIGLALWMGYHFNTNFDFPYKSATITEFWRRWHISLSSWLRDYVYISLGGNRKGKARTYLNLLITMLLGGLWHGANIRFVLWGAMHGVALAIHKFFLSIFPRLGRTGAEMSPVWRVVSVIITFHFVCFTWIFFRMGSIDGVWDMLTMITEEFHPEVIPQFFAGYRMVTALIIIGFILHFSPDRWRLALQSSVTRAPLWAQTLLFAGVLVILTQFRSAGVQPFIYFQF